MRTSFVDSCILGFCLLACLQCILVSTDATNSFYVLTCSTFVLTLLQTLCMKLGLACILLSDTGVLIGSTFYFFVCSQLALAVVNFAYVLSKINNVTFNTVLLSTSFSPRIYILNTLLAMLLGLFFLLKVMGDPLIPSLIA